MERDAAYAFGGDRPKRDPGTEDRLGYAAFARHVARVIVNLDLSNGYVIGLHSRWGRGKSTALNFVLEYLKEHNEANKDNQIIHIAFRPWIVSGRQDVVSAFFKTLSESLGTGRGRFFRAVLGAMSPVALATDNLVQAATRLSIFTEPTIGHAALRFTEGLAKTSIKKLVLRYMEEPSLQKTYERLREHLTKCGKRFIVTIDDVDRLEDADVRTTLQMVKSIGQLPNIVYLLAYDRRIVWKALGTDEGAVEPGYAEKIVQQEIELPAPSMGALLEMLHLEVPFLEAATKSSSRGQVIRDDGTARWIRSPRDVVRLSNAVRFSRLALEGEVDDLDLFAMEGLRLFDHGAYAWIRDHRDFLLGVGRLESADEDAARDVVAGLEPRLSAAKHRIHVTRSRLGVVSAMRELVRRGRLALAGGARQGGRPAGRSAAQRAMTPISNSVRLRARDRFPARSPRHRRRTAWTTWNVWCAPASNGAIVVASCRCKRCCKGWTLTMAHATPPARYARCWRSCSGWAGRAWVPVPLRVLGKRLPERMRPMW